MNKDTKKGKWLYNNLVRGFEIEYSPKDKQTKRLFKQQSENILPGSLEALRGGHLSPPPRPQPLLTEAAAGHSNNLRRLSPVDSGLEKSIMYSHVHNRTFLFFCSASCKKSQILASVAASKLSGNEMTVTGLRVPHCGSRDVSVLDTGNPRSRAATRCLVKADW